MKSTSKEQIRISFRRLLFAKSLDKITVRDIVEDCGLTRNTFYYYYEDIYDLFDDYLDACSRTALETLPSDSPWDRILLTILRGIFDSPQTARHIMYSKKNDTMRLYLNRMLGAMIDRHVDRMSGGLTILVHDRQIICDAMTHAVYGLLEQWLTGPEAHRMDSNLVRLARSFSGAIRSALEYCATNPAEKEDPL
ncbi:MAG: TetR/AcrR family transcriptional regulator C-terminal domain-containing protein [Oscillospiraceae bacterium]|nr:TetR/AcrR family transcriptional regulator C-terminal domain-containing protein [Oscillospiraceae bacterium]